MALGAESREGREVKARTKSFLNQGNETGEGLPRGAESARSPGDIKGRIGKSDHR